MIVRTWSASVFGVLVGVLATAALAEPVPSTALIHDSEHEAQPLVGHDRGGPIMVVYDGGAPSLQGGREMTSWVEADRFVLNDTVTLAYCRFWTLEVNAWDGACQFLIYENAGGAAGAVLFSGPVAVNRTPTGRDLSGLPETENNFSFPPGITLGAGSYFLGLHMASTCSGTFAIGWENSSLSGATAEQAGCAGAWLSQNESFAFLLFGESECPPPAQAINPLPANGATNVPLNPTLTWNNPGCDVIQDVINGGFESGDFTGWGIVTGPGSQLTPWAINSGGFYGDGSPAQGAFFAINGFDGDAGLFYEAFQEVYIPIGAGDATISWFERVRFDVFGALARPYRVTVQPPGGGSVIETLHAFDALGSGDTGYVFHASNLSAYQGQTVRIAWREEIPETFTGPAQFQLDAVNFGCAVAARPEVSPAAVKAFDESFERSAARYAAAQAAAQARPIESPTALSAADHEGGAVHQLIDRGIGFNPCNELFGAATSGAGSGPSDLYRINPTNGAASLIGPIGFNGVSGLSFHPITGVLYASCNADAIYGGTTAALITIDPNTGAGTLIGPIGSFGNGAGRFPDISFGPNGVLYGFGDNGDEGLYTINTATGAGTLVGFSGTFGGGNGMDFDLDGRLYQTAWDDACLHELNPATGASACVAGTTGTLPGSSRPINALDFNNSTGALYGSMKDGISGFLITIDKVNGGFAVIGQSVDGLDAIAFRCSLGNCASVFNGGSPDLVNGNEMTSAIQANDFVLFENTRVRGGRFWTLDTGPWDGVLEYWVHSDAGGIPGAVVASGTASADRFATGRNFGGFAFEMEWRFDLPAPGLLLPPGTYWLALHASGACGFDGIYWETGSPAFGNPGNEQFPCGNAWSGNAEKAFQLCGEPVSGCCGALYGAATGAGSGSGSGPSTLYLIDPINAFAVPIGPIGFNGVSGLSFDGLGRLYGSCNADFIFGGTSAALIRVNPMTGAGALIGKIGDNATANSAGRFPDISFAANGTLYGYGDFGSEGLYTISTSTGAGTFVGFSGTTGGGNGMDFANDGRLYGTAWDSNCVHEINPANGSSTCVPGTSGTLPQPINALEFCKNTGVLYATLNGANQLGTIDPVLGGFTPIGTTVTGIDAIAFRCPPVFCPTTCRVYLTNPFGFDIYDVGMATSFNPPRLYCNSDYAWAVECFGPGGSSFSDTWFFRTGGPCPLGDANADGVVNFADVTEVLAFWLSDYDGPGVRPAPVADPFTTDRGAFDGTPGSGPGDANCDGEVNFADVTEVLANWLSSCP